jgi:hypothetical protein
VTFPRTERELVEAAKERAAQRERDRYLYPGDAASQQVARRMWIDFMRDPSLTKLSTRKLATMYPTVSHVTADRIRKWILSLPRPPEPPLL